MALITAPARGIQAAGLRMGASLMRSMCNATAAVGAQSFGVFFNEQPGEVQVGGMSIQARQAVVRAWAADLPAGLIEGSAIGIGGNAWLVAIEPVTDTRTGIATFAVERA